MARGDVTEVASGVFLAEGTDVNWVLIRDGDDVTLVDAGWAGDRDRVEASIRRIGCRPGGVRAILLTHAHIDHLGAVNAFHERYGTPLYCDPVEVGHAHRDRLEQAGIGAVMRNLARPGVLPWSLRVARVGGLGRITAAHAQAFPRAGALDLPGGPVPVASHGHTSGHSAYHLPAAGAVVSGDGLVTAHPTSPVTGPQVLGPMFNHGDPVPALAALEQLDADLLLPGHGPAHRGPIADAVARARERAS